MADQSATSAAPAIPAAPATPPDHPAAPARQLVSRQDVFGSFVEKCGEQQVIVDHITKNFYADVEWTRNATPSVLSAQFPPNTTILATALHAESDCTITIEANGSRMYGPARICAGVHQLPCGFMKCGAPVALTVTKFAGAADQFKVVSSTIDRIMEEWREGTPRHDPMANMYLCAMASEFPAGQDLLVVRSIPRRLLAQVEVGRAGLQRATLFGRPQLVMGMFAAKINTPGGRILLARADAAGSARFSLPSLPKNNFFDVLELELEGGEGVATVNVTAINLMMVDEGSAIPRYSS